LPFDDYNQLVELVVSKVGQAQYCIDMGAGTGNGTIKLLESNTERQVWTVDSTERMLEYLKAKVNSMCKKGKDYLERLTIVKDDIERMGVFCYSNDFFDAAILINVLYAIDSPKECLQQIYRILKPGGILALSTAHSETVVDKLFCKMKSVLEGKNLFEPLQINFKTARQAHDKMINLIHRDTKDDIRQYVEDAGFRIEDWHDKEYAEAVVVVKAIKT